jgi:hypothetical protein
MYPHACAAADLWLQSTYNLLPVRAGCTKFATGFDVDLGGSAQIFNAIKYSTAFPVIIFSAMKYQVQLLPLALEALDEGGFLGVCQAWLRGAHLPLPVDDTVNMRMLCKLRQQVEVSRVCPS